MTHLSDPKEPTKAMPKSRTPRRPRRPRRRRAALFGCGGLFVLCVLTVIVWMQDEPPHDDSDLQPPAIGGIDAAGPTVLEGILSASAQVTTPLPTLVDDLLLEGAPSPWGPSAIDRAAWDQPAIREELQDFVKRHAHLLDDLHQVIERKVFGVEPLEAFDAMMPGVLETRTLADALALRALERRLAGS